MTIPLSALPNLTPLDEVAASLGIPPRRLADHARGRKFTHVRIGKERYFTDAQLEEFLASHTVAPEPTPKSDRDKAVQDTRARVARQRARRKTT
ncbi:helix-turn-helix domain-containing protein [Micromonospora sp. NPDC049580]|uniref:helix-turn-helix domain-containing protein n=1 Tax=Micromonospora sp. NPDC049580 TaxID=3154832 RepID=UPI0034323D18